MNSKRHVMGKLGHVVQICVCHLTNTWFVHSDSYTNSGAWCMISISEFRPESDSNWQDLLRRHDHIYNVKYLITTFCGYSCSFFLRILWICRFLFQPNVPVVDCQNGYCENNPCLNGGTCHETFDVTGKRFTCECGPHATGKLCETGKKHKTSRASWGRGGTFTDWEFAELVIHMIIFFKDK